MNIEEVIEYLKSKHNSAKVTRRDLLFGKMKTRKDGGKEETRKGAGVVLLKWV